ncbi:MAG TPA: VOC family protein [Jatrophihabitantaceae bacterium]
MTVKMRPRLVVQDAAKAIEFYGRALGATEVGQRHTVDGKIVHVELSLGDLTFSLKDADGTDDSGDRAPTTLGGTPVIFGLDTDDADAVYRRLVDAGASVVFPLADHEYGLRQGRVQDPFGHLWIVSQAI